MGNEQSAENERKRQAASIQISLERSLEKQRALYEKRCKELLEEQAQSLSHQGNTASARGVTVVAAQNSGGQNTLYPNLSNVPGSGDGPGPSSASVVTNLPSHNVINENQAQMNSPCSTNIQNLYINHNRMSRPIPSAPQAVSCSSPNVVNRKTDCNRNESNSEFNCRTCGNKFGLIIFQCNNGHSSCQQCKFNGSICREPNCGKTITDIRNRTLEAYMADLSVAAEKLQNNSGGYQSKNNQRPQKSNCPNQSDGCSLRFYNNEIDNHLKECPFNEMFCPLSAIFGQCYWRGKINHLDSHFSNCHPEHRQADINTEMTILNIKNSHRIVYLVVLGSYNFLIHVKVDVVVQMIYMVVQLLGTNVSAMKWSYEFHLYNKAQPRRKYTYSDVCVSNTACLEDIFTNNKCAAIPLAYAATYENKCSINYKFYIKKQIQVNMTTQNNNN